MAYKKDSSNLSNNHYSIRKDVLGTLQSLGARILPFALNPNPNQRNKKRPAYFDAQGKYEPLGKGWQTEPFKDYWFVSPETGLSILCGVSSLYIVDIDRKRFASQAECDKATEDWLAKIGMTWESGYIDKTGGGGYHILFKIKAKNPLPTEKISLDDSGSHHGEFLGEGAAAVCAPSPHPSGGRYEPVNGNARQPIEIKYEDLGFSPIKLDLGESHFSPSYSNPSALGWGDYDLLLNILSHLSPDIPFKDWFIIGSALKSTDDPRALAAWEEWSRGSYKFKEGDCRQRWKAMKFGHIGAAINVAKSYGWSHPKKDLTEEERKKLWVEYQLGLWERKRGFTPNQTQENEYVSLPQETLENEDSIAIKSPLGTGKTRLMGEIAKAQNKGYHVIGYRNNLLVQTCHKLVDFSKNTPHHLRFDDAYEFLKDKDSCIVYCVDSLLAATEGDFEGKIIFIDELVGFLHHAIYGNTLGYQQHKILGVLCLALQECHKICLFDANLKDMDIRLIERISDRKITKIENTKKPENPRDIIFHEFSKLTDGKKSSNDSPLLQVLIESKCLIVSDSKKETEAIREFLTREKGKKGLGNKIFVINSETDTTSDESLEKLFLENPQEFIRKEQPDSIIISPTGISGLDIHADGHFDCCVGLFKGVVLVDGLMQILFRLRDDVPIHVVCPQQGLPTPRYYPNGITAKEVNDQARARFFLDKSLLESTISKNEEGKAWEKKLNDSLNRITKDFISESIGNDFWDYFCERLALDNIERKNLNTCLMQALINAGHNVFSQNNPIYEDYSEERKDAKEKILKDEALGVFKAEDLSEEEYEELREKKEHSPEEKMQLRKHALKKRLPGIEESEAWSWEFVLAVEVRSSPNISEYQKLSLLANHRSYLSECLNEQLWKKRVEKYTNDFGEFGVRLLKSSYLPIWAMNELGVPELLESLGYAGKVRGEDSNFESVFTGHPKVSELWGKFEDSPNIQIALGIYASSYKKPKNAKKDSRPIKFFKDLMRLLGLKFAQKQKRIFGKQTWTYILKDECICEPFEKAILKCCESYWDYKEIELTKELTSEENKEWNDVLGIDLDLVGDTKAERKAKRQADTSDGEPVKLQKIYLQENYKISIFQYEVGDGVWVTKDGDLEVGEVVAKDYQDYSLKIESYGGEEMVVRPENRTLDDGSRSPFIPLAILQPMVHRNNILSHSETDKISNAMPF